MKTLTLTLAAASVLTATAAFAASDIQSVDRNGDRFASYAELTAVYPGISAVDFRRVDANRDNRLSSVEFQSSDVRTLIAREAAAAAGSLDLATVDTDGDNFVSFTELAGVYPGLSANDWDAISGLDERLTRSELYALETQVVLDRSGVGAPATVALDALDTDGSSFASFGELASAYPGLSTVDFRDIDLNDDNRISFSELNTLDTRSILGRSAR